MSDYGYVDLSDELIDGLYWQVVGAPANFLSYAIGGLEFEALREKAEKRLGADFSALEFHRFLLEFGPAPFPILEAAMDPWMGVEPEPAASEAGSEAASEAA